MTEDQDNKEFEVNETQENAAENNNDQQPQEAESSEENIAENIESHNSDDISRQDDVSHSEPLEDGHVEQANDNDVSRANRSKGTKKAGVKKPDKYRKHLLCRYGKMANLGYFSHDLEDFPDRASHVIVNTERGLEIAQIVAHETCHKKGNFQVRESQMNKYMKDSCDNFPLDRKGEIVRVASEQDIREQQHLDEGIAKELSFCEDLVKKLNLDMTLIDAERLFGGERIIFYFMADGRVDFRQLVKDLAQQYQTRIEMRQVGARDEARLVADFETCGRECCCKSFLKVLYPVNMRMAKLQKATLDPSKISGRCGRLKCCLRFEDEVYQEHKKKLPKKNSTVLTPEGYGKVVDAQVLTLLVKVYLAEGKMIALPVDEILEFNYVPPAEPETPVKPEPKPRRQEKPETTEEKGEGDSENSEKDNNNRRGRQNNRRRKPRDNSGNDNASGNNSGSTSENNEVKAESGGEQSDDQGEKKKKRRRRRRKKKKPTDGQSGGENTSSQSDSNE